jgi:hypothetical protein
MRLSKFFVITILFLSSCIHQNPSIKIDKENNFGGGIIYGKEHAFTILAPQGWVLDNQIGVSLGLYAVFYPTGSTWKNSDVVMYIKSFYIDDKVTLKDFIESDIQLFKSNHGQTLIVKNGESIQTGKGKVAEIRIFSGDKWGNFESVAYLQENKVIITIVLTSRNENLYLKSIQAFQELIESYYFITSNVDIIK